MRRSYYSRLFTIKIKELVIDADTGIVEATDTTPWFGFQDDVVIRVTDAGASGWSIFVVNQGLVAAIWAKMLSVFVVLSKSWIRF